jgi:hypothetical protein
MDRWKYFDITHRFHVLCNPISIAKLLPVFARLLEEKPLFLQGTMSQRELDLLLERLPAQGLYISTATLDED